MRRIDSSEELRSIQMGILDCVDKICRKHHIEYSISGGTLLGAIRHKGFIPWDDDIDIMLTRDNYDRLINVMNSTEYKNSYYLILTHQLDSNFKFPYAKVVDTRTQIHENVKGCKDFGVFIDIFPFDFIPNDDGETNSILRRIHILINILMAKRLLFSSKRPFIKNVIIFIMQFLLCFVNNCWLINRIEKIARNAKRNDSNRRCCLVWGYGRKEIMPKSVHESYIDILFENRTYRSIKEYETYLSGLFGDYMQLPPEEKRITHHAFDAWWKD